MTNRLSEDAAPDNEQSGTVQTDNTSSAALDKTGARRKRSASWGTARNNGEEDYQWTELIDHLPENVRIIWRAVDDLPQFWRLLHAFGGQSIRVPRSMPKDKGHTLRRTLGWHACASSWRFLGAQASIFRAAALLLTVCASATSPRIFHTAPGAAQAARQQWQTWRAATAYQTGGCGRF